MNTLYHTQAYLSSIRFGVTHTTAKFITNYFIQNKQTFDTIDMIWYNIHMKNPLVMEPGRVVQWQDFVKEAPQFSLAIDGYVPGRNNYHIIGDKAPIASIDHHKGVDRIGTGATCKQVLDHLRLGLRGTYDQNGIYVITPFANDCDEDVCTSDWLLGHPEMVESTNANPAINRLVGVESNLDVTGGLYPYDKDMAFLGTLKAIFRPYKYFRNNGGLEERDPQQYLTVVSDVGRRITDYVIGNPIQPEQLDPEFEVLRVGDGWSLLHEVGEDARMGIGASDIKAFISVVETDQVGVYKYTLAKKSPFVRFPIEELYDYLNIHDPAVSDNNFWSGSDTIGGSPRSTGSMLAPDNLFDLVQSYITDQQAAQQ